MTVSMLKKNNMIVQVVNEVEVVNINTEDDYLYIPTCLWKSINWCHYFRKIVINKNFGLELNLSNNYELRHFDMEFMKTFFDDNEDLTYDDLKDYIDWLGNVHIPCFKDKIKKQPKNFIYMLDEYLLIYIKSVILKKLDLIRRLSLIPLKIDPNWDIVLNINAFLQNNPNRYMDLIIQLGIPIIYRYFVKNKICSKTEAQKLIDQQIYVWWVKRKEKQLFDIPDINKIAYNSLIWQPYRFPYFDWKERYKNMWEQNHTINTCYWNYSFIENKRMFKILKGLK